MKEGKITLFGKLTFPADLVAHPISGPTRGGTRSFPTLSDLKLSDLQKNEDVVRLLNLPKVQSLLGWLILNPGEQSRQLCAEALWPGSSPGQSLTNLRREIHRLKSILDYLPISLSLNRTGLELLLGPSIRTDHGTFFDLIDELDNTVQKEKQVEIARNALELSSENLLVFVRDEWIYEHRFKVSLQRQRIAQILSSSLKDLGHWESSLNVCQLRTQIDPADEAAMADLLDCLIQLDRTAEARRLGKTYINRLTAEMNGKPSDTLLGTLNYLKINPKLTEYTQSPYPATQFNNSESVALTVQNIPQEHVISNTTHDHLKKYISKFTSDCGVERPLPKSLFYGRRLAVAELSDLLSPEDSYNESKAKKEIHNQPPQFILVKGEPGIGKTRLVEHVLSKRINASVKKVATRCVRSVDKTPFSTLGSLISNSEFQTVFSTFPARHQELLNSVFGFYMNAIPENLNLGSRERIPAEDRITLFLVLANIVGSLSSELILYIDDIQWIDRDSLDWLMWFVVQPCKNRITVLATLRNNRTSSESYLVSFLRDLEYRNTATVVSVERLGDIDAGRLFDERFSQTNCSGSSLDSNIRSVLLKRADGVPFFIEEFAKTAGTNYQSSGELLAQQLPSSIVELFTVKFLPLSTNARETCNYAAVMGRFAARNILFSVSTLDFQQFSSAIEELQEIGILQEYNNGFLFDHDLTRDALLDSMSMTRKTFSHHRCALAYQRVFHKNLDSVSVAIAEHYDQSDDRYKAIEWYVRAACNAEKALALQDGLALCSSARKLLEQKGNLDAADNRLLLNVYLTETEILSILQGFAAPGIHDINQKMKNVLKNDLPLALQFQALARMRVTTSFSADCREGVPLAQQMVVIAEQSGDPDLLVEAERSLGFSYYSVAKFKDAHVHYKKAYYHAAKGLSSGYFNVERLPFSVLMMRRSYAKSLVVVGQTREALALNNQTDQYPIKHLGITAQAHILFANCVMNYEYQNPEGLTNTLHHLEKICEVISIAKVRVIHDIFNGWCETKNFKSPSGFALMEEACVHYSLLDEEQFSPMWRSMLAQRYYEHGEIEKSLLHIDCGLKISRERNIGSALASLYLWKALCVNALHLHRVRPTGGTACDTKNVGDQLYTEEARLLFRLALENAMEAGARLAELRIRIHYYNTYGVGSNIFSSSSLIALIESLDRTCDGTDMDSGHKVKEALSPVTH